MAVKREALMTVDLKKGKLFGSESAISDQQQAGALNTKKSHTNPRIAMWLGSEHLVGADQK